MQSVHLYNLLYLGLLIHLVWFHVKAATGTARRTRHIIADTFSTAAPTLAAPFSVVVTAHDEPNSPNCIHTTHGLWHLDYHQGSRRVAVADGRYHTPWLFAVLDDRSRMCPHLQWYLRESADTLHHGLIQAFHKRGLPRGLMTDNGGAETAGETENGLQRLGITHHTTLAYSAYQNGKQEDFWGTVEGRLMAMLENEKPLTLEFLNRATQAWVELEYNQRRHSEIRTSPIKCMLAGPDVSRPAPDTDTLRFFFTVSETRTQRRSDGTIAIKGIRFEIPNRFRHIRRLQVRYQSWDLTQAYLVDPRSDHLLARIFPQDKAKNADGRRRALQPLDADLECAPSPHKSNALPPLMRKLLAEYAATGLPPAYLPMDETQHEKQNNHNEENDNDH